MNGAHLHLLLVHLPVVGILAFFLFCLVSRLTAKPEAFRAGMFALVLCCFSTGAAYLTGEEAEEIVEHLPGVSEHTIEEHEEFAVWGLVASLLAGASGLAALFWKNRTSQTRMENTALAVTAIAIVTLTITARLGGEIRHPEAFSQKVESGENH